MKNAPTNKAYLGDAVYANKEPDGTIVLTTENGVRATNTIFLEPQVLAVLQRYLLQPYIP